MDDTQLNRMAIEEIVREMQQEQEKREKPVAERKLNPLGPKPNKRFLGRTIHSVLNHNKREEYRTKERCRRKLVELDKKRKKEKKKNHRSPCEVYSSSSDSLSERPRRTRKKKTSSKYRRRSSSSSGRTSEDRQVKPEHKEELFEGEEREDFFMQLHARAVYNQMNLLQYQAIIAGVGIAEINEQVQKDDCRKESSKSNMKKERKTNSNPSRSSSEESESLVTINLSSDDNPKSHQKHKFRRKSSSSIEFYMDSHSSSSSSDDKNNFDASCISLDSNRSFSPNSGNIVILSDSSETETKVVNESSNQVTAAPPVHVPVTKPTMIDLTED